MSTDVRTLLHDLADDAPAGHGEDTADRVVEVHRLQDRRRLRWAGVAAVVAVVVAAAPSVLSTARVPAATAIAAGGTAEDGLGLYDVPTRGSLAGDETLLAQAVAASWDDGTTAVGGTVVDPPLASRRVAFVGEVSGGQAWALVLGRMDGQAWFVWFADVTLGDGITWERAWGPDRSFPDTPVALYDSAGEEGPLVVVAQPGDQIWYSSTGSGPDAPEGAYQPLETVDGVAVAVVPAPQYPRFSIGFRVLRDGVTAYDQLPQQFDSHSPLGPQSAYVQPVGVPPADEYGPRMVACLATLGYQDTVTSDGEGVSHRSGPGEDEQAYDAAVDTCSVQTGYR